MTRTYSDLVNSNIRHLLETLADKSSEPNLYKKTMYEIGINFGQSILSEIKNQHCSLYLACTVEDADFLAKGILDCLENEVKSLAFACFWNQRFSPFEIEDLKIAPIIKKYQEPSKKKVNYLVVVKSIISGACVVKTNLINLIQKIEPEKIFIVAPVMYHTAEQKLKSEFEPKIYEKFQYFYFAKDDERTSQGEVIPGIGGIVYDRLGFNGQDEKNLYIPNIVKLRRETIKPELYRKKALIRILLVDDQIIIRQGLKSLLESQADFQIVGEAENGKTAIALVAQLDHTPKQPDLILMDVRMPVMDGVAAIKKLAEQFSSIPVLVLSTFDDDEYITQAMQFGAKGYLLKDTDIEEIASAIRNTVKGYTQLGPGLFQKFLTTSVQHYYHDPLSQELANSLQALSPREKEVLSLIAQGANNKEIAEKLYIAERTVKAHVTSILSQLNLRDRTQAAILAIQYRLL
jgi:DNA-binding NarL/FixJ family response regulator